MMNGWVDGCVHCTERPVSVCLLGRGERSLCLWYHPPPSTSSFHYLTACTQTLMCYCFRCFYKGLLNLKPALSPPCLCLCAGHELLSELQQRRFNGSEGGGGGQGGEEAAVGRGVSSEVFSL